MMALQSSTNFVFRAESLSNAHFHCLTGDLRQWISHSFGCQLLEVLECDRPANRGEQLLALLLTFQREDR
jgi:hypothetical protein